MKLELTKEWFENNIPHDSPEVGVGLPERDGEQQCVNDEAGIHQENEGLYAILCQSGNSDITLAS